MNTNRRSARVVGALFITATVAGVLSLPFTKPINAPDYLINVSANSTQVVIGALLELIMAVAVGGIAIAIYPILKKHNEALALGYVGARIIEGLLFIVGVISLLTLVTLSQEFVKAGTPDASCYQTSGTLLLAARDWANNALVPTIAFGLSMLIFYYLLYQSKLIPRWLSVWGLIGAPLYIAAGFSAMFGGGSLSTTWNLLMLPIGVNEMVLAVWLIVKGFNPSAIKA